MEELQRRIVHALYLDGWEYEGGSRAVLLKDAQRIRPDEYSVDMKGHLFCPVCFTNLNRVPHDKEHTTSNMEAHYRHLPRYQSVPCGLRSNKTQGKKYNSYESISQAIDNDELVIVNEFMQEKPKVKNGNNNQPFTEAQIEDLDGPESEVPLGVHNGESFKVPSKITSLRGICYNFDKNYYRYYYLPGNKNAIALTSLLTDARKVVDTDDKPKLYFVKLQNSKHLGKHPSDDNIRMTFIESSNQVVDFCIKTPHWLQKEHGIGDNSEGRYALVFGKVTENGLGLCFEDLGWGELALVPEKYNYLIDDVYMKTHGGDAAA